MLIVNVCVLGCPSWKVGAPSITDKTWRAHLAGSRFTCTVRYSGLTRCSRRWDPRTIPFHLSLKILWLRRNWQSTLLIRLAEIQLSCRNICASKYIHLFSLLRQASSLGSVGWWLNMRLLRSTSDGAMKSKLEQHNLHGNRTTLGVTDGTFVCSPSRMSTFQILLY